MEIVGKHHYSKIVSVWETLAMVPSNIRSSIVDFTLSMVHTREALSLHSWPRESSSILRDVTGLSQFLRSLVDTLALGVDTTTLHRAGEGCRQCPNSSRVHGALAIHNVGRISEVLGVANELGTPCKAVLSSGVLKLEQACGVKQSSDARRQRRA